MRTPPPPGTQDPEADEWADEVRDAARGYDKHSQIIWLACAPDPLAQPANSDPDWNGVGIKSFVKVQAYNSLDATYGNWIWDAWLDERKHCVAGDADTLRWQANPDAPAWNVPWYDEPTTFGLVALHLSRAVGARYAHDAAFDLYCQMKETT